LNKVKAWSKIQALSEQRISSTKVAPVLGDDLEGGSLRTVEPTTTTIG